MLKLYENIRARRIEMNLSQQKLAEMTGYADKSAIAKIEKGIVDIPQSKLELFASALKMKPWELLGTTDPDILMEEEIIALMRKLNLEGKEKTLDYVSDLVASGRYALQHSEADVV